MTRLPTITEIAMRQHTMNTLELVIDLPFLARKINDAHRQVQFHGKSMLMEAKRAGEALLAAKKECKHGSFETWLKAETRLSLTTAREYMRVAKLSKSTDLRCFEGGVRAFLDAHVERPEPSTPREFTREDAERALKFHALATRGATEGEQKAASAKLASFAKEYGMTPEAAVAKAREFLPEAEKTEFERNAEQLHRASKAAQAKYAKDRARWEADVYERDSRAEKRIKELEEKLEKMAARATAAERRVKELEAKLDKTSARREELYKEYSALSMDELLNNTVWALLQLEGF